MSYKIILDSCGEQSDEMLKTGLYSNVPLTLQVGETKIIDDETFDQKAFLDLVASTSECPKSACPAPATYMEYFEGEEERVYVVTLSEKLSGSYNSAVLAKNMYQETSTKKIHVFNSKAASPSQTIIALKIDELEKKGLSFEEIVDKCEKYTDYISTIFILEDLGFLEKNGRLTGLKKLAVSLLNIVPIMQATDEGSIGQKTQARGMKSALTKMIELIVEECKQKDPKRLIIAHCNCPERAKNVSERLSEQIPGVEIIVNNTQGVASLYAGNGGIIVAF